MRIRKRKPIGKKTIKYIEKLYEAYSRKLFCIAKNHVKDNDLAQDVVQSVFEKALVYPESILKVPEEEVFTLLKNEKNNEHESLTYEDGSEGDFVEDPRDNYLQMIDLESLKQNLAALPRRHRDTILFRYVYGLKCKEIADLFRITERSVKNRCREARELLRQMMEADEL